MAYKSYRIKVDTANDEKVVNFNMKQGIDTIKVLSLEINSEDMYQLHTSNYGVVVGRVLANNSYGVPNVKVSVFVALDTDDQQNSVITSEYPYSTMQVKDGDGKKYNLLPKSGFDGYDGNHVCVGSFPDKRLVLDNNGEIEIFEKYWKYTTVTNEYGDYMIFGIPTGSTQIHIDCDISDIGLLSQRPYDLIAKGYDESLFESPTKFKTDNLDSLPQILSQTKTVNTFPFWGDSDENRIGITRCDINLDYEFTPCCVFMGSSITDPSGSYIGVNGIPNGNCGRFGALNTSTGNIEIIRKTENNSVESLSDNVNGIIDGNGVWCYQIPMNLDKIGMDEEGNIIPINVPGQGIPTRARVRMRISLTSTDDSSTGQYTAKMLIPCNPKLKINGSKPKIDKSVISDDDWDNFYKFGSNTPDCCFRDLYWNKVYSVKCFYPRIQYGPLNPTATSEGNSNKVDYSQMPLNYSSPLSCISFISTEAGLNTFPYNTLYSGAENSNDNITRNWFYKHLCEKSTSNFSEKGLHFCFENDWINGCIYLPKVSFLINKNGESKYYGSEDSYDNIYLTGRHELLYNNGRYRTHNIWVDKWNEVKGTGNCGISKTSRFSQVKLPIGLIQKQINSLGASVYYYRCGGIVGSSYYRLYSTDIITLGNLMDVFDNYPKLFKKIPSTTAFFPPVTTPKELTESGMNGTGYKFQLDRAERDYDGVDYDLIDIHGNRAVTISKWKKHHNYSYYDYYDKYGEASKLLLNDAKHSSPNSTDIYSVLSYIIERMYLFFIAHCCDGEYLQYNPMSFVNLSRICELNVHNDHIVYGSIGYNQKMFPINGMIDRFDISSNEARSEFASMNYDITNYIIDSKSKRRVPLIIPLYLVDFDGRLMDYTIKRNFNYVDEEKDESYVQFRYGDTGSGPLIYPKSSVDDTLDLNCDMIIPENSFYFYFGLNSGFSAIDVLNKKFCGSSNTLYTEIDDAISVEVTDTKCVSGVSYSNADVYISDSLVPPITYYITIGDDIVSKGVNNTNEFILSGLTTNLYKVEITDSQNHVATHEFEISDAVNNMSFHTDSSKDYSVAIYNINESPVKSLRCTEFDKLSITTEDGNVYYIKFDHNMVSYDIKDIVYQFYSESGSTKYVQCSFSGAFKLKCQLYIDEDCSPTIYEINLLPLEDESITLNNVPVDLLKNWDATTLTDRYFNSTDVLTIPTNFNVDSLKVYSEEEQLSFISEMMSRVWGNDNICLSKIGGSQAGAIITVSPSDVSISDSYTASEDTEYDYVQENYEKQKFISTKGYGVVASDYPNLVSANYPLDYYGWWILKKASYNTDGSLNLDYIQNPLLYSLHTSYGSSLKSKDLNSGYYVGINYNPFSSKVLPSNWPTSSKGLNLYNITKNQYVQCVPDELNGLYRFQTNDRRMDYQFSISTPVLLPSGLDKFQKQIPILDGHVNMDVLGGVVLRLSYDSETDTYTQKEYELVDGVITRITRQSNKLSYYTRRIYEDGNIPSRIDSYPDGITIKEDTLKDNIATNRNKMPHFNAKGTLNGVESFNMALTDCNCDISDGIVKGGNEMLLNVSYEPGLIIDNSSSTLGDGSFNLLYKREGSTSKYLAHYDKTASGSTFNVKLNTDTLYNGDTWTNFIHSDTKSQVIVWDNMKKFWPAWANEWSDCYIKPITYDSFAYTKLRVYDGMPSSATASNYVEYDYDVDSEDYDFSMLDAPYLLTKVGNSIEFVSDSNASNLLNMTLRSSESFSDYTCLMMPCTKIYRDLSSKTLLKQGVVFNNGYAYYASKIEVTKSNDGKYVYVQLYSPLLDSSGNVDYSGGPSKDGKPHLVGEIKDFTCANHTVEYDANKICFTITLNDGDSGTIDLYFDILNGLRYKVQIEL